MRRIIGIGETVLDVIFRNDKPQDAIPGGSTFNSMISLGRTLPAFSPEVFPVSMVTEVGDDHIGDIILSFMKENGVSAEYVTRHAGSRSHLSMAFLDDENNAQYEFYKDHSNAGLSEEIVSSITFREGDIVLYGSFFAINPVIRNHTGKLLTKAREAGAILYYDINFRKNHIQDLPDTMDNIIENCSLADFVRGSSEDFRFLFGTDDGSVLYDNHIASMCQNFILTRGAEPTEVYQPDCMWSFPVPEIETVSTIGAGDNFNAGFIYALIKYGIGRENCFSLQYLDWERVLAVAGSFSSAVCRSIYNYVDKDFRIK